MSKWLLGPLMLAAGCVPGAVPHDKPKACGLKLNDPCRTCADTSCCAELTACSSAPGCKALSQCLADCQDAKCRVECSIEFPAGETREASELAACLAGSCEEECELPCGALAGVAEPEFADECQTCLSNSFCEDSRACAGDAGCQAYVACRRRCDTGDCIGACLGARASDAEYCLGACTNAACVRPCGSEFDGVVERSSAIYEGYRSSACASHCNARHDWSCVDSVALPTIRGPERHLTVAFDVFGEHTKEGIEVDMCPVAEPACPRPISHGVTDADGVVHLVDTSGPENGSGNGLIGFLKLSAPFLYPGRVYWGFRLSEQAGALGNVPIPVFSKEFVEEKFKGVQGGILSALALDCAGTQAEGVQFSLRDEEPVLLLYAAGSDTRPSANETDESGTGFFLGLSDGKHTVVVTPRRTGVVASEVDVYVETGTITGVALFPN